MEQEWYDLEWRGPGEEKWRPARRRDSLEIARGWRDYWRKQGYECRLLRVTTISEVVD